MFWAARLAKHDISPDLNSCNILTTATVRSNNKNETKMSTFTGLQNTELAGVYLNPIAGNEGYNSQLMWALQNEGWSIEI